MNKPSLFFKFFLTILLIAFVFIFDTYAQQESGAEAQSVKKTFTAEDIKLFPNPATDVLTVRAKSMEQVEIINMLGRVVIKRERCRDIEHLETSSLKEGLYFVRVTTRNNQVAITRFVKK